MSKRLVLGAKVQKKKEEDFDDESPAFLLSDSSSSDDDEPARRALPPAPTAPPPLLPCVIRMRVPSPSSSSESEDEEPKYRRGKRATPQVARSAPAAAPQQEGLHAIAKKARRIAKREVSQDQLQRALSLSALESRARQIEELRGEVQIRQAMIASLQDVQAREQSAFSAEEARRAERAQARPGLFFP